MTKDTGSPWNVAFAIDQGTVDRMLGEIYAAAPSLFATSFALDGGAEATVTFMEPPRLQIGDVTSLSTMKGQGTFSCGHIAIAITGSGAGDFRAALSCMVRGSGADGKLLAEGIELFVDYGGSPAPPDAVRDAVSDKLLHYLRLQLFPALAIPVRVPEGGGGYPYPAFAAVPQGTDQMWLTACADVGDRPSPARPCMARPGNASIALNESGLAALILAALPRFGETDGGCPDPNYSWTWNANAAVQVELSKSKSPSGHRLRVAFTGRMDVTLHVPVLPNVSGASDFTFVMSGPLQLWVNGQDSRWSLHFRAMEMAFDRPNVDFGGGPWILNKNQSLGGAALKIMDKIVAGIRDVQTREVAALTLNPVLIAPAGAPPVEMHLGEPNTFVTQSDTGWNLVIAAPPAARRRAATLSEPAAAPSEPAALTILTAMAPSEPAEPAVPSEPTAPISPTPASG